VWKKYDPAQREVLNFTNNGITYGADPIKARLDLCQAMYRQ
jgi:para-nitrobenzyl esterase